MTMFHFGATDSLDVYRFILAIGIRPKKIQTPLEIFTLVNHLVILDLICCGVRFSTGRFKFLNDLVGLVMSDFVIIHGMDWMAVYKVKIDCYAKMVTQGRMVLLLLVKEIPLSSRS